VSHETYLDEPADVVDWLLAVDGMHRDIQEREDERRWRRRMGDARR
jgi:hypothetical protein